jgi:hypothetical protein
MKKTTLAALAAAGFMGLTSCADAHRSASTPNRPSRVISVPWSLKGLADGGRVVIVGFTGGGCLDNHHARAVVREGARTVGIAVLEPDLSRKGAMCPLIRIASQLRVRLRAPLDGRTLRHLK